MKSATSLETSLFTWTGSKQFFLPFGFYIFEKHRHSFRHYQSAQAQRSTLTVIRRKIEWLIH